jgi:hypothetical protein
LDNYLRYNGPVKSVNVIIPAKLKGKVNYDNASTKSRIAILPDNPTDPNITIKIPSAQLTKLVQSGGTHLMFRSNEFETEIKEIFKGVNDQYIFYVQEPCDDISFDSDKTYGVIHLSCPKSKDIIIHTERHGTGQIDKSKVNVRFMPPSISSSVTLIDKESAVIARTVKSSDSEVTIKVDKVDASKVAPKGKKRRYMIPKASATIDACK